MTTGSNRISNLGCRLICFFIAVEIESLEKPCYVPCQLDARPLSFLTKLRFFQGNLLRFRKYSHNYSI